MADLQIFNYGEIPVRTVLMDGEPWWVLADVCWVLNIKNPSDVKNRLDADEKMTLDLTESVGRRIGAERNGIIKNEEKWGGNGENKKEAQLGRKSGKMWAKNVIGC